MVGAAQNIGRLLLRESECTSLEDVVKDIRARLLPNPSPTGIPKLDVHYRTQNTRPRLGISGRGFPLLYHLTANQLSLPQTTLVVLDLSQRFSASHLLPLLPSPDLLQHLHVFFPTPSNLTPTLENLEKYMLYGEHNSKGRKWVGTIVIGEKGGGKGDVWFEAAAGWRGWCKVEREEVGAFPAGVCPSEVVEERGRRQGVLDGKGWRVSSEAGEYIFKLR